MSYVTDSESDMDSESMVNSDHKHSPCALSTEGVASSPRKLQTGKISPNKPQPMVNENICSASSNDTTLFLAKSLPTQITSNEEITNDNLIKHESSANTINNVVINVNEESDDEENDIKMSSINFNPNIIMSRSDHNNIYKNEFVRQNEEMHKNYDTPDGQMENTKTGIFNPSNSARELPFFTSSGIPPEDDR